MENKSKTLRFLFVGTLVVVLLILMNLTTDPIGGKNKQKSTMKDLTSLEETLMQIEGIGEVFIYFHYADGSTSTAKNYFALTPTKDEQSESLKGLLVVAEGASDVQLKYELQKMLSAVLGLPEHRIEIVEMKKRGIPIEGE